MTMQRFSNPAERVSTGTMCEEEGSVPRTGFKGRGELKLVKFNGTFFCVREVTFKQGIYVCGSQECKEVEGCNFANA